MKTKAWRITSIQIVAEQSGHFVQLDQPGLVIDAIREVMDAIQN